MVTHEHDIANFAGRIIVFRDGRVLDDRVNAAKDAAIEAARLPSPAT
ncbi:MAG: hypothetical protein AAB319_09615 [Pseudomonadota bacterium]